MILMCWGLARALRIETLKRTTLRDARVHPGMGHPERSWKARLRTMVHHPSRDEVERFLEEVARPAFEQVREELKGQNVQARVEKGDDGRLWVEVLHGEETDFYYLVRPRRYEPPSFVLRDTRQKRLENLKFYRAEVHFKEGGQDYDIMGWSQSDVIHDVIDQYERHLHFLNAVR